MGITTRSADTVKDDVFDLLDDFTYVLHVARTRRGSAEFHQATQANASAPVARFCDEAFDLFITIMRLSTI